MIDYIIIGAGYAGLSAAAILEKEGLNTLLLESHSKIGGCASFYKRKEFTFDVGATTLSGLLPNQPLGKLFNELKINPKIRKIDPGAIINIDGKEIRRETTREKWIQTAVDTFENTNQKIFWEKVFNTDDLAWQFLSNNKFIPPSSFSDYLKLAKPTNAKYLKLFSGIYKSIDSEITDLKLDNPLFHEFLDEQLLITTQNVRKDAPFLTAAMGLAYPSETYYPYGGMYKPAQMILEKFKEHGGQIKLKRKITRIEEMKRGGYRVTSSKGEIFESKGLITSIPIWNMAEITEGQIRNYYRKYSSYFDFAWGAFTLNFAIESNEELDSLYYQIHTPEIIPNCNSKSFFVSFSAADDFEKAPEGWRSVTISCHTKIANWQNLSKDDYNQRKEETTRYIISNLMKRMPQFQNAEIEWLLSGTPGTFEFYTQRKNGFVGGIPHSTGKNLLKMPPNKTPFKNLYQIGDTAFPGQGTPGVVLGAFFCIEKILN